MELHELLLDIPHQPLAGAVTAEVTDLCCDSRKAGPGSLFVCLSGARTDGHDYIAQAYGRGARAFLVENPSADLSACPGATVLCVANTRRVLALASARFFGQPARRMTMIGVTGTKGKTSVSFLLASILSSAGIRTGVIGTTGIYYGDRVLPAENTTPESCALQRLLRDMADDGCRAVVMEVSSQGLKQHRTDGIFFDAAVFGNLSADHIGPHEHAGLAEYAHCKSLLFTRCRTAFANADSPFTPEITAGAGRIITYGLRGGDWRASGLTPLREGSRLCVSFQCDGPDGFSRRLTVGMPGAFSVYNALAAVSIARQMDIPPEPIERGLREAVVCGRTEPLAVPAPYAVLIDYAHNALSMESLMEAVSQYHPRRIIAVFGCGGNRARARRTEMGAVAGRFCHLTVLTSDNPRDERVSDIIDDIVTGLEPAGGRYEIVPDRARAIGHALSQAGEGDMVLIIGKGHQRYEEIAGVRHPFDDRQAVRDYFERAAVHSGGSALSLARS